MSFPDPFKEKVLEIAALAKDAYVTSGISPSVTIAKHAAELPNEEYLARAVEQANQMCQRHIFEKQGDLREEFPLARPEVVQGIIEAKAPETEKVASAWMRNLPIHQAISAPPPRSYDPIRKVAFNEYGFPVDAASPVMETKTAERTHKVGAYDRMQAVAGEMRQVEFEKRAMVFSAAANVKKFIKTGYDLGENLFKLAAGIVFAMEPQYREGVSEIVDDAVKKLAAERAVKVADLNEYMDKTASVDISKDGYVIHRGGDQIILQLHTTMGYIKGPGSGEYGVGAVEGRGGYGNDQGSWFPGGVDDHVVYEVKKIVKPKISRPYIQKGVTFS
jgi:hypothetical protein